MNYVDGFVSAASTVNRAEYRAYGSAAAVIFKEHGAVSCIECWGDDEPDGKLTSFPMAVKCQPDGTGVFSWIVWPSRQARYDGMKKVMRDPRLDPRTKPMPFDRARLIFGSFEMIVNG